MDGFNYIEDHFETTVKPRILEQYKESGRWQACLEAVVSKLQAVEDSAFNISKAIDFKTETPTGAKLDWVAGLINVKRFSGESDEAFFLRFVSMCGANTAGTPNNVIYNAAILSGDTAPQYMDEAPATFFVYDGPRPEADEGGDEGEDEPFVEYLLLENFLDSRVGPSPDPYTSYPSAWTTTVPQMAPTPSDPSVSDWEIGYWPEEYDHTNLLSSTAGDRFVDTRTPVNFSDLGVEGGMPFALKSSLGDYEGGFMYGPFSMLKAGTEGFTMECWYANPTVEFTIYGPNALMYLQSQNGNDVMQFTVHPNLNGKMRVQLIDGSWNETIPNIEVDVSNSPDDGSWHHYAVTCDGTKLYVFFDGTKVGDITLTAAQKDWLDGLVMLRVASNNNNDVPDYGRFAQVALTSECKWTADFTPSDKAYSGTRPMPELVGGGSRQLSLAQVLKLAPAGVLGLPGAAIQLADGSLLGTEDGRLILVVADDAKIEREVLLADNLGNIVITPNSVPVRVKLTGPSVPSIPVIETEWNGVPVDAVRIKDLPDGADTNGYMVRDSDTEGTVKSRAMDEAALDELWDSTPAEGEGEG